MNTIIEQILKHKSIRHYQNKPIAEDILNDILTAASRAATTGNMQLYSIIVNQDEKMKQKIAPLHFNQPAIIEAPLILTFCADFNRFIKWCNARDARHGYDNMQSFMWAVVDTCLAAQNACLVAEAHGLGTCYLGTTTYNAKELAEAYHLPKYVVPICCLTIGYPDENPEYADRLPLEGIIHHETYKDYSSEDIDNIYHERENSELTKRLLEENQLENLAKIFTERRYTKKDNEYFAERLLTFLKEQDFFK